MQGLLSCTSDNTRRVLHVRGPDSIASTIMNENRNVPTLFFTIVLNLKGFKKIHVMWARCTNKNTYSEFVVVL